MFGTRRPAANLTAAFVALWLAAPAARATVIFDTITAESGSYAYAAKGSAKDRPAIRIDAEATSSLAQAFSGITAGSTSHAGIGEVAADSRGGVSAVLTRPGSGTVLFVSSVSASVAGAGGVAKAGTDQEFAYGFHLTEREAVTVSWTLDDACGPVCGGYAISSSAGRYDLAAGGTTGGVEFLLDAGAGWLDIASLLPDYALQNGPGLRSGGSADRFLITIQPVPELSTSLMLGLGLTAMLMLARRARAA